VPEAALKWKFHTGGHIESAPYINDDVIYFGSNDGYFYALDINNGDLIWKHKLNVNICSTAVVIGSRVFVGADDCNLYAFDRMTGDKLWQFETEGEIDMCTIVETHPSGLCISMITSWFYVSRSGIMAPVHGKFSESGASGHEKNQQDGCWQNKSGFHKFGFYQLEYINL